MYVVEPVELTVDVFVVPDELVLEVLEVFLGPIFII